MISFSGSHLFFICRLRGWMNPALPYARVIPPAVPRTRSPPPSFHYTVRSRASLDYGRCVKSAGVSRDATHKGRALSAQQQTSMSYIEQFESELAGKLNGNEDTASIVRWVSEKVLESYRNGITAGGKGATVIRKGESRRRGSFGKAE